MVTVAQQYLGDIPTPSVTICAHNALTELGYSNTSLSLQNIPASDIVGNICQSLEGDDIVNCVEKETFNLTTIVKNAVKGLTREKPCLLKNSGALSSLLAWLVFVRHSSQT